MMSRTVTLGIWQEEGPKLSHRSALEKLKKCKYPKCTTADCPYSDFSHLYIV